MSTAQSLSRNWRFNRQLGFAIVIIIVLQGATILLWVGRAGERITQLETRIESQQDVAERLARLETHMVQTQQTLNRIENQLDKRP